MIYPAKFQACTETKKHIYTDIYIYILAKPYPHWRETVWTQGSLGKTNQDPPSIWIWQCQLTHDGWPEVTNPGLPPMRSWCIHDFMMPPLSWSMAVSSTIPGFLDFTESKSRTVPPLVALLPSASEGPHEATYLPVIYSVTMVVSILKWSKLDDLGYPYFRKFSVEMRSFRSSKFM